jgi:hypothetical protein
VLAAVVSLKADQACVANGFNYRLDTIRPGVPRPVRYVALTQNSANGWRGYVDYEPRTSSLSGKLTLFRPEQVDA